MNGRHITAVICGATSISGTQFCEVLGKLGEAVEVIDLNRSGFDESVLTAIAKRNFTHLRVFRAGDCQFSGKALAGFLKERGKYLQELDLSGLDLMPQELSNIARLTPNLLRINVSRTNWNSAALKIAFQEIWTDLDRLEARFCKGFSFEKISLWPALKKLSHLDIRGTVVVDSKKLVNALPDYMTHILLGEVTPPAVQGLMAKLPTEALGMTTEGNWQLFQSLFEQKDIFKLYLTNCTKLGGQFFRKLEDWPLKVLSVAGTSIQNKHLKAVKLGELVELDLSYCSNLNGEYLDWDLQSAKRVRLAGLTWVDDNIHVRLLAEAYVEGVGSSSGYVETMGEFTARYAREMRSRLGWECAFTCAEQTEFPEPMRLTGRDPVSHEKEGECWDEIAQLATVLICK